MSYIYLVPGINESNSFMYCNYAREDPKVNRCLHCKNYCKHKGKKTVIEKRG